MKNIKNETRLCEKAAENFLKGGYSCSESIIKAAMDEGIATEDMIDIATSFSGGMSSGCLCGAVAGAQMVLGLKHGRTKTGLAREKAKAFMAEFKEIYKATCCKALTQGLDFTSPERKEHCSKMVKDCGEILEKML